MTRYRHPPSGLPRWILTPAWVAVAFVALPLLAMVLAVDWPRMASLLTSPSSVAALALSVRTSLASTAVCIVLGVPLAMLLARSRLPGLRILRGLVLLPLVLPPVVGGIALLYAFGRRGLIGQYLELAGVHVAFTTVAVVLAQSFVALPFLVLSLEGTLRTAGDRYEQAAATLGASPGFVVRRVTLPLVLPGIVSAAVLAFARALGEFGATLTFAGSLQGVTRTLPLEVYLQLEVDPDAALALSVLLIVVAGIIVATVYDRSRSPGGAASGRKHGAAAARGSDGGGAAADAVAAGSPVGDEQLSTPPEAPTRGSTPGLHVHAVVRGRGVEVALDVAPGDVVAVLGANGSGKSTLLGLVSGLVTPDEGTVVLGERVLVDTSKRVRVPVHDRGLATLSQDALLFPHLSAIANVAFGPRAHRYSRAGARHRARIWLAAVGLPNLAARRPHEVSGGQAQRIGLARALASDPGLLLLDEPLAALDVAAAAQMRVLLRQVCRVERRTTLLVTHDLLDVFALADQVVVMQDGRIVEQGPPSQVLTAPRSLFAAQLAGVNLLLGTAGEGGELRTPGGGIVHGHRPARGSGQGDVEPGRAAVAVFAPAAVALYLTAPHGSPRNVWPGTVRAAHARGDGGMRLQVDADDIGSVAADLTAGAVAELGLQPGTRVHIVIKAQEVALHRA